MTTDDPIAAIAVVREQLGNWTGPYRDALDTVCRAASRTFAAEKAAAELVLERDAARQALEQRQVVDRAKAILIRQCHLSEHDSHRLLQRAAMQSGRQLSAVAATIVAKPSIASELANDRHLRG